MVKKQQKQQKLGLQKRDWAIVLLFIAVIASNWVWYQYCKAQDITNRSNAESWLQQQVEINTLKDCIDSGVKPCDITQH